MGSQLPPKKANWLLWLIPLFFCIVYFTNLTGWLIHDDEGTDLYEAWQLQIGHQAGVEFIAEQQPLFLQIGQVGMNLFTDDVLALRLISAVQVLAGTFFLGWVVLNIWGRYAAAVAVGLILTSGLVYEQARLYRPDPMMFGWELFGFGFVLLALKFGKRPYWAAAGLCYGLAVLMKPFGIFPVVGLLFFFAYMWVSRNWAWPTIWKNGLTFSLPFLAAALGISILLYAEMGFYYQEAFSYHQEIGGTFSLINQLINIGDRYLLFFVINASTAFILPLAYLNRRSNLGQTEPIYKAVLFTQLFVPLSFVVITRPMHVRYFMFLVPTLAIFLAIEFNKLFQKTIREYPKREYVLPIFVWIIIVFAALTTLPNPLERLTRTESGTRELAALIQSKTEPHDVVVADYASLNFHAKRQSIYEASIIAGGQIGGGIITGSLLIEKIEMSRAKLILMHTEGGDPPPHQLTHLIDFEIFEDYLEEHYMLVMVFDRGGQLIEVYERK